MLLNMPIKLLFFFQEISPLKHSMGLWSQLSLPSVLLLRHSPMVVLELLLSHRTVCFPACLFCFLHSHSSWAHWTELCGLSVDVKYIINTSYIHWAMICLTGRFCVVSKWGPVKTPVWTTAPFLFRLSAWAGGLIYFTRSSAQPSLHNFNGDSIWKLLYVHHLRLEFSLLNLFQFFVWPI